MPIRDLRTGTVKARRPRASAVEAKRRALHGAEHRSSIDRVMAGGSQVAVYMLTNAGPDVDAERDTRTDRIRLRHEVRNQAQQSRLH